MRVPYRPDIIEPGSVKCSVIEPTRCSGAFWPCCSLTARAQLSVLSLTLTALSDKGRRLHLPIRLSFSHHDHFAPRVVNTTEHLGHLQEQLVISHLHQIIVYRFKFDTIPRRDFVPQLKSHANNQCITALNSTLLIMRR